MKAIEVFKRIEENDLASCYWTCSPEHRPLSHYTGYEDHSYIDLPPHVGIWVEDSFVEDFTEWITAHADALVVNRDFKTIAIFYVE